MTLPQPSPFSPQLKPCCLQERGVHDASIGGASGSSCESRLESVEASMDPSVEPSVLASGLVCCTSSSRPVRLPQAPTTTTPTSDATAAANPLRVSQLTPRSLADLRKGGAGVGLPRIPLLVRDRHDSVATVHVHHPGPVRRSFLGHHPTIAGQNDEVAGLNEVGSGPIDADVTGATSTRDDVGGQTGAVGDVVDVDLFVLQEARALHEIQVDGDGADVVQVGPGDRGAMDLAEQEVPEHGVSGRGAGWNCVPADAKDGGGRSAGQCRTRWSR